MEEVKNKMVEAMEKAENLKKSIEEVKEEHKLSGSDESGFSGESDEED